MGTFPKTLRDWAAAALLFLCALPGCGLKGGSPQELSGLEVPAKARVSSVPFFAQDRYQCGPASLAMALAWSGVDTSPQELVQEVYTPQKKGSLQPDLKAATRRHGRLAYEIFGLQELLSELSAGHPVIVLQNLGLSWLPRWHYAVVVGFDRSSQELLLHSGRAKGMRTGLRVFHRTWRRSECWGLLVLEPGDLPATAKRTRYLEAVLGLEEAEKWRAAAKGYEAGLSRWPESITAVVGRASCLYRMGSLEAAEKMLKRGIERHPSKPELYNNLAHILLQLGKRREALQAARSAVDIGGSNKKVFEETLQEVQSKSR